MSRGDNLEEVEKLWGIQPGVEQEWGHTFDKLVNYHNLPNENMKDTVKTIFGRVDHEARNGKQEILEKEMRNWVQPRLKPQLWKKYLWPTQYEKEEKNYNVKFETIFGSKEFRGDGPISKDKFINGIINELRDGNTEVCFSITLYINNNSLVFGCINMKHHHYFNI